MINNQILFNRKKFRANRDSSIHCSLFEIAAEDLMDRLELLDKDFCEILDIGSRHGDLLRKLHAKYPSANIVATDTSTKMIENISCIYKLCSDDEELSFGDNNFDLISYSLGIHAINHLQDFLKSVHRWLSPSGVFVANFVGGNSFKNVYSALLNAEIATGTRHSKHIMPFIKFEHVTSLLQQAGFGDIIVDYEIIDLQHKSVFALMKSIQKAGESNILVNAANYAISKSMLKFLKSEDEIFCDKIELISLTASKNKGTIECSKTFEY